MIRDEIYRLLLLLVLLLQINGLNLIPVGPIGRLASWLYLSWMYAFYCFEYKWLLSGWTLQQVTFVFNCVDAMNQRSLTSTRINKIPPFLK